MLFICIFSALVLLAANNAQQDFSTTDHEALNLAVDFTSEHVTELAIELMAHEPNRAMRNISRITAKSGIWYMLISAGLTEVYSKRVKDDEELTTRLKVALQNFKTVQKQVESQNVEKAGLKLVKDIKDTENAGPLSRTRRYIEIINTLYEWLPRELSEQELRTFGTAYDRMYAGYTLKLYQSLMQLRPESGIMDYDLIERVRRDTLCNARKIEHLCYQNMLVLNRGMILDGAYNGTKRALNSVAAIQKNWDKQFKQLLQKCERLVDGCKRNFIPLLQSVFNSAYDKYSSSSNRECAHQIFNQLYQEIPYKRWAVIVYNDASGFNEHTYFMRSSNVVKRWNENWKDVTVAALETTDSRPFEKSKVEKVVAIIKQKAALNYWTFGTKQNSEIAVNVGNTVMSELKKAKLYNLYAYVVLSSKNTAFYVLPDQSLSLKRLYLKSIRQYVDILIC